MGQSAPPAKSLQSAPPVRPILPNGDRADGSRRRRAAGGRMIRRRPRLASRPTARRFPGAAALAGLGVFAGCRSIEMGEPRVAYVGKADLEHYVDRATSVASPDEPTAAAENVATLPPHSVGDLNHDETRGISLAE